MWLKKKKPNGILLIYNLATFLAGFCWLSIRILLLGKMELDLTTTFPGNHRHLKIIDCLMAHVFFISTVNGRSKKKKRSLL